MEEIINDYRRRLSTANDSLGRLDTDDLDNYNRLKIKAAEYRSIIAELSKVKQKTKTKIKYLKGDATNVTQIKKDTGFDNIIISHICNNKGAWGAGFVMALSRKWSLPETEYYRLGKAKLVLGHTQFCVVDNNVLVANMIAQEDVKPNKMGVPMVRYGATKLCLDKVFKMAKSTNSVVVMPEIGCGLGGGVWSIMEATIETSMNEADFNDVYVYKFG